MSLDDLVGQVKRGVDKGVQQVKRTANAMEAEARILALQRKVGLRVYQLWRAGQLSHPDLLEDLEQIARLEAKVDEPGSPEPESPLDATRVGTAGAATCRKCARPLLPGSRFCTYCGQPQGS